METHLKKPKPKLLVDWATHKAAKYACENWHYSKCIPKSKLVKLGVWEDDSFIGVVIFGVGATSSLVSKYGLKMEQGAELVRIALTKHKTPVSRIVAVCLRFLVKANPGLRLLVSFADPEQGHHGGIYQAMNWIYTGKSSPDRMYKFNGKMKHPRAISLLIKSGKLTRREAERFRVPNNGKHRYLLPLNSEVRDRIEPLSRPYPKRASSVESGTSPNHGERGGESPTDALQLNREGA